MTTVRYYPAIVEIAFRDYSVFLPDLDGCASGGTTLQEAAGNAEVALALYAEATIEKRAALPEPSSLDEVKIDADVVEAGRILVCVEVAA
jgi:predicted RNase H-like HicB family nuclease